MAEKKAKKPGKRGVRPKSAAAMLLRRRVAAAVQAVLDTRYPVSKYKTKSAAQQAAARDAGVSWSTIQRALNPERSVTLDVLADLAVGFDLRAALFLTSNLADSLRTERVPLSNPISPTISVPTDELDELHRGASRHDPD